MNPVFLFDEIDKMGRDFQGDPASAMLEVLDAQQNNAFRDHYLELPFDLSQVLFLTTANDASGIPGPLRDRMEIIRLSGYTQEEKLSIAKHHLVPRQLKEHGLTRAQVRVTDKALRVVIDGYTREAGVRQLEREVAALMRKAACKLLDEGAERVVITPQELQAFLGRPRFLREKLDKAPEVGVARGLAYTDFGGETLAVETTVMPGAGALELTGQLGDVMKESARAAMSYVRAHADSFGLAPDFHKKLDTHIHVPEGAVPKDGPSAGVALTCSLVSALTGIPLRQDLAMTGEITLRGPRAPCRRHQGKIARRAPRGHSRYPAAQGKRGRSGRFAAGCAQRATHPVGRTGGRGAGGSADAHAAALDAFAAAPGRAGGGAR